MNPGSAIVSFNGLDVRCGIILMHSHGDREHIRIALRKASSHRRRLVSTRPSVFFVRSMHELQALAGGENVDYLGPDRNNGTFTNYAPTVNWRYRIWMKDRIPTISFGNSEGEDMDMGLFHFLGIEYKRPYEWTEARKKRRGGRPSGLRRSRPDLFTNLGGKRVAKQQAITSDNAAAAGKALDLKNKSDPRRIIRVDFTETPAMRQLERYEYAELDPDYDREMIRIYELEGGAQP